MDWLRKASITFKNVQLVATMTLLAFLSACGGGGFDETTDPTDPTNPTTSVTTVTMSISDSDVDAANPGTVTATVSNSQTGSVAGVVVTFTTTLGVLNPASGTALTDADGQATIEIQAGTVAGAGEITGTVNTGGSGTIGFSTAGDGTDVPGKIITLSTSTASVSAATPATITATVTDAGQPVAGEVITFTTSIGVLDPGSGTALTDASGQATITLAAGTEEGAGLITAAASTGESNTIGFATAGDGSVAGGRAMLLTIDNNSVDSANPRILTATVTDDGNPVANEVVNFTTTLGVLDPISGTALTNAAGQATITLAAGTVEGAGVATASLGTGEVGTVGFTTAGDGTVIGGRSLVIVIDNPSVDAANPRTLTATLLDAGTPVAGEVVTFTSSLGVLDPISGTALTNASGQATITLAAGTVEGAGVAIATVATGEADTVGFNTAGDGTVLGGRSLVVTIDNPNVDAANPRTVTATLLDAGTPVANEVVTFTTTLGIFSPASGTALTDASGQATITLAAGTVEGAGVVTATVATGEADTLGFYTAGDGTTIGGRSLVVTIDNPSVDAANPRTVTATLLDAGTPVTGEVINFSTTLGTLNPVSGTALTDGAGQATITLNAGTVQGAGVVQASVTTGEIDTVGFSTAGDATTTGVVVTLVIDNTSVADATPRTLTATVTDSGAAVVGEVVSFSSSLGLLDPISGTGLTNASGQVSITLNAGTVAGAGVARADITSGEFATVGFTTAGDSSATIKTINVVIDDINVDAANPRTLTATVLDAGAAVQGEVVNFATTLGALDPVSGTALTDASGQATITLTAGSVAGAGLVTATTSTGESDTVGFNTAGDLVSGVAISLDLTDTGGTPLNPRQINRTTPGVIEATITGITQPVLVTFTSDIGNIPVGTAITDASNVATVDIFASDSLGAGTITATLTTGETAQLVFSIGASSLGIGTTTPDNTITPDLDPVADGGTTTIPVTIWDTSGAPVAFTDPVDVTFSSACSAAGLAIIDSPVTTINGVASATYRANGCEITDTITATANAGGVVLSASGSLTVTPALVGSLEFVSATPESIVLQGTGGPGNSETSVITFRLLDSTNNPMEGELVCFNLNTTLGGITVIPNSVDASCPTGYDSSGNTDANGEVSVTVVSGTAATTVRVTAQATVSGNTVSSQSSNLVVSTGIPDQDSFSLSADILNPDGWDIDGTEVNVTARLADAFNNPAPDGTVVSFITEGGAIEPSCTTANGACSVTWTSQNARPAGETLSGRDPRTTNIDNSGVPNFMGQSYGGRVTITATAIGNETFPDLNGNGLFDSSEEAAFTAQTDVNGLPFDLKEAFVDYNEDGFFNPQEVDAAEQAGGDIEEFIDFDFDGTFDLEDLDYNGVLCGTASNCSINDADDTNDTINIRGSVVLVMSSGSQVNLALTGVSDDEGIMLISQSDDGLTDTYNLDGTDVVGPSASDIAGYRRMDLTVDGTGTGTVVIADLHNQPMPVGTVVEFVSTTGSLQGTTSFTWPNHNKNGGTAFSFALKAPAQAESGLITVEVTPPGRSTLVLSVMSVIVSP